MAGIYSIARADFPLSDHFDGEVFRNIFPAEEKGLLDVLRWKFTSSRGVWPDWIPQTIQPQIPKALANDQFAATFINHSTVLVQLPHITFITDPIYAKRASPVPFAGPKRYRNPGVPFESLPKIDAVLVSHNHYDHMNIPTLLMLRDRFDPWFFVPLGNRKTLASSGIIKIVEMDWWNDFTFNGKVRITLVPAQHWSMRSPFDKNKTLWGGYYVQSGSRKIYFAGDTGYSKIFEIIRTRLGPPDLALIPIGSYKPSWFMKANHLNPSEAVQVHLDLQSKASLAIHFGTFALGDDGLDEPKKDLQIARNELGVSETSFRAIEEGSTWTIGPEM